MVNNLRQSGSARTLLMRWRSLVATKREVKDCSVKVKKNKSVKHISSNIDASAPDVPDQLILLKHLLKGKFGVNSDLTLRQQQNRLKSDSFNLCQQNSLEFIHRSAVIPLNGSESVSKLSVIPPGIVLNSLRPNLCWDFDKCQRISDQILRSISSSQDER